jgi:hypothetical protein
LIHSLNAESFGALQPRQFVRPDTPDHEGAIAMAEFDAKQVVIHDGKVVQIECREKIRVVRDEPGRKSAIRQIRQPG